MALPWMRRLCLVAAGVSALLLGSCGGGTVESKFGPDRVIAFGDGMGNLGQNGNRYTVNDGSVNNWTVFVANAYDRGLAATTAGGLSYATGNARITAKPDAGGSNATPTVQQQVDSFLGSGAPTADDLVIVSAGTSDVIAQVRLTMDGRQSSDDMLANVKQAGIDLANQVKRLVGAWPVVLANAVTLGLAAGILWMKLRYG